MTTKPDSPHSPSRAPRNVNEALTPDSPGVGLTKSPDGGGEALNQTASAVAYAALSAIEAGRDRVELVNAIPDERLDSIASSARKCLPDSIGVAIPAADLLLMIAEIRQGRTTR